MNFEEEIKELRSEINTLNRVIIEKIKERINVAEKIGEVKKRHRMPVEDKVRESIVYQQIRKLAEENLLPHENIERIFKEIISICIDAEEKI